MPFLYSMWLNLCVSESKRIWLQNISNSQCYLVVEMGEIPGTRLYTQWGRAELAPASLSFHVRVSSGQSRGSNTGVCQGTWHFVRVICCVVFWSPAWLHTPPLHGLYICPPSSSNYLQKYFLKFIVISFHIKPMNNLPLPIATVGVSQMWWDIYFNIFSL